MIEYDSKNYFKVRKLLETLAAVDDNIAKVKNTTTIKISFDSDSYQQMSLTDEGKDAIANCFTTHRGKILNDLKDFGVLLQVTPESDQ